MDKLKNIMFSGEKGQAFPFALIILAIGSIFVGGFLASVNTSFLTSDVYSKPIPDIYTADAGIEDAIWGFKYGTLANAVESGGGKYVYNLSNLNGLIAGITVTGSQGDGGGISPIDVAWHDFEDQSWGGGGGKWDHGWIDMYFQTPHGESIQIISKQSPYQGRYHVQMNDKYTILQRAIDLSAGYSNLKIQFWAKARSLQYTGKDADKFSCIILGPEGQHLLNTIINPDYTYSNYELDLSPYTIYNKIWIRFELILGKNISNKAVYLDDIKIVSEASSSTSSIYTIRSMAGERTATATLELVGGVVSILSWEIE